MKLNSLLKYWDDVIDYYTAKAIEIKNERLEKLMYSLVNIPNKIKEWMCVMWMLTLLRFSWVDF